MREFHFGFKVSVLLLCLSATGVALGANASQADLSKMTKMLDDLDRQELEELVQKARSCTKVRNFDCSRKMLGRAEKLVHGQSDRMLVSFAREDLNGELSAVAREEELARLEREERERQEEEERELARQEREREQQERDAAAAQSRAEMYAYIQNKMQEVSNYANESAKQVYEAQRQVAEINRQRQAEANRQAEYQRQQQQERMDNARRVEAERRQQMQQIQLAREEESRRQAERERMYREQQERDRAAREEKQRQMIAQQQAEEERRRKAAEAEAARQAAAQAEESAKAQYLQSLADGTRLRARKCLDGEGKYYVVGILPKIKPKKVGCVDLHYSAYCPGSGVRYSGLGKNFIGFSTDCYMGDTYAIEPKPACPVEQVSVVVDSITACQ